MLLIANLTGFRIGIGFSIAKAVFYCLFIAVGVKE
jgi:hypothetical protein|nr:MAG TPA: hypothetical protein [Caudoviricetes sp.]